MIEEGILMVKDAYSDFTGGGMYFALFLIAMLYIHLKEKDKRKRVFLIYYPLIAFIFIINPLFYQISKIAFSEHTYFRMFWVLPMAVVIAYAAVLLIREGNKKLEKFVLGFSLCLIIVLSGKFYYITFMKFGNLYKLPDESVLVAQLIGIDEEENKKALVPADLVDYIRQIDGTIELLYGRQSDKPYWNNPYATELDNGNVEYIVDVLEKNNCQYVVYKRPTVMREPIQNYGYEMISETVNYVIFKKVK